MPPDDDEEELLDILCFTFCVRGYYKATKCSGPEVLCHFKSCPQKSFIPKFFTQIIGNKNSNSNKERPPHRNVDQCSNTIQQ